MKRLVALALLLAASGVALYFAQGRKTEDRVSGNALMNVAADWQHNLSRAPMRLRLSDADEVRIGRNLVEAYGIGSGEKEADAAAIQDYVSKIGARVASHAHRKIPFTFFLDSDPNMINAFALPGGNVVVGLGLLRLMHSEDELAFVPGHEIEQIDHIMPWSACRSKRNCTSWIWTLLPIGESPARDVAGRICEGRGK